MMPAHFENGQNVTNRPPVDTKTAHFCWHISSYKCPLIFQVMPIYMQSQWPDLDWYHYFNLFEKLPPQYKRVGEIVGVEEGFLARAIRGRIPTRTEEQRQKLAIHHRFYSALVLLELVNEIPLKTVSRRYNVNKGLLQSLQNSASTFAGMVTKFCQKLGWRNMEMLVDQFQSRLSFGVTRELCDLVRISMLNGARARLLYNAGYHSASAVATASVVDLTKLLENFAPFESHKTLQGETARELASKKRVRSFWVTGKDGMTENQAAALIINEAKELVKDDLASLGFKVGDVQFMGNNVNTQEFAALRKHHVCTGSVQESRKQVESKAKCENNTGKSAAVQSFRHIVEGKTKTLKRRSSSAADLGSSNKRCPPPQERNIRSLLQPVNACNASGSSKTANNMEVKASNMENRRTDKENVLADKAKVADNGISALAKRLLSKGNFEEQFLKENDQPVASNDSPSNKAGGSSQDDLTSATMRDELAEKECQTEVADIKAVMNEISSANIAGDRAASCVESGTVERHSIDTFDESISLLADEPKCAPECAPKYDTSEESISLLADEPKCGPEDGPKYDASEESVSLLADGPNFEPDNAPNCGPKYSHVEDLGETAQDNGSLLLNDPAVGIATKDQILERCRFVCAVTGKDKTNSFDAVDDNSLEEANGSLILISSNEDDSVDNEEIDSVDNEEIDCKKDNTPELFSEPLCGDSQLEMEIYGKEEKGRGFEVGCGLKNTPLKEKSPNMINALITEGKGNAGRTCYLSNDVESDQNEKGRGCELVGGVKSLLVKEMSPNKTDALITEGKRNARRTCYLSNERSKSAMSCDNENPLGTIFDEELAIDNTNFDSFGGYDFSSPFNVMGEKNVDSFCLKLSESMAERVGVSPELIDQPPNDGENDSSEGGVDLNEAVDLDEALDPVEALRPGLDRTRNESRLLAERLDADISFGEDQLDSSDIRPRPETKLRRESRGICRRTVKGDDKTTYTKVKERTVSPGPNNSEIIMSGSESFANALCDAELLDPVPVEKGKRDNGVGKRRSSERIAKRNLNLGQIDKFSIVDVTSSNETFNAFVDEWRRKQAYSFSVARMSQTGIGSGTRERDIVGISVCLAGKTAYFVDFQNAEISGGFEVKTVIEKILMELVRDCPSANKVIFDAKEHYKVLHKSFDVDIQGKINDPKVAAWLLNPSSKESTLQELAFRHLSDDFKEIARSEYLFC